MGTSVKKEKICVCCGQKYLGSPLQKLCPECRHTKEVECKRRNYLKKKEENKQKKKEEAKTISITKEKKVSLSEICRLAKEAGMTYGQYVSKMKV